MYIIALFKHCFNAILAPQQLANGSNGTSHAETTPSTSHPSSLKLLQRLFSQLDNTLRLSQEVLKQLGEQVHPWGQHLTKVIKAADGGETQSKQQAVRGIQFWTQMINALGNFIVTTQRELTNNICVVMGAGFKSTRRDIVVETLAAWKALISAFATEKQWSAVGTKGKSE